MPSRIGQINHFFAHEAFLLIMTDVGVIYRQIGE